MADKIIYPVLNIFNIEVPDAVINFITHSTTILYFVVYAIILLLPVLWAAYPDGLHNKTVPDQAAGIDKGTPTQDPAGTQGVYPAGGPVQTPGQSSGSANEQGGSQETTARPAQRPAAPGGYTPYTAYRQPSGGPAAAPESTGRHSPAQPANNGGDTAEQILRYKALLDEGAITADEYEAKKKQLLGL